MICKNCDRPLSESDNFCNNCGAQIIRKRLTVQSLFAQFSEQFLNYDNKLLQTFLTLFRSPEMVIGGYIQGIRKKYMNVVNYFAVALTFTGFFFFFFLDNYASAMETINAIQVEGQNELQVEISRKVNRFILDYQSVLFFLFIPLFAFYSRVVFLRNKKYNYTEHIVINMYAQSQMSIVSILLYFSTIWFEDVFLYVLMFMLPLQMLYFAYALKRMYQLSLWQIILKFLLFALLLIPSIMMFGTLLWALLFITGVVDFQEFIEAEKAKQGITYIISSAINWTS